MKTISKILAILLCLTMVLGMAVMASAAETTATTYTLIDEISELKAGTYKVGGYATTYTYTSNGQEVTKDWTNNPYHLWSGSFSGSMYTTPYAYSDGILTCTDETYPAVDIELVAVENKANTYYVKYNNQYLYSSQYNNNKLGLTDTPTEWVASNHTAGGIMLTTTLAGGNISLGTAGASSKLLRSYKDSKYIIYGTVFFSASTGSSHTHTWSTTASKVESKNDTHHTNIYPCTDTTCTATNPVDEAHTLVNNECTCGYKYVAPTVVDIKDATTAGTSYTVKGVVTLLDGQNIYVQDATGGICVRVSAKPTDLKVGDTIIGTGKRDTYNGLPQLGSATYEKSTGMTLSAKETTIDKLTTADIGTYIKLVNVEVTEVFDSNGTYTAPNITVKDAAGNKIQIYKAAIGKTNGAWDVKVGDKLTVTAAVGVYKTTLQLRNTVADEIVAYTPPAQTGDTTLSIAVALMAVSAMGIAVVASKKKEF